MQAELLIKARWIAPVDPPELLPDHALAVTDGRITAVLPTAEAEHSIEAQRVVELPTHLLIPGLINAHTHAAMTLLRGYADDLPLEDWLQNHIWPAETRWVSAEYVRDGTLAACAEMLAGGTTTFADMYFFPGAAIDAALELGQRIVSGIIVIDFPSSYAADAQQYLDKGLALNDKYRVHPLVSFMFAPHAPYTVDETTLAKIASYVGEIGLPVQIHLHETAREVHDRLDRHGARPLAHLLALGLVGPGFAAVHMTQVEDADIETLVRHKASVIHCPESNLKLASGFCPVKRLQDAGVNIALGTDGAASNNDLDLIGEMRTAALLAKGVAGDPTALNASAALHAATLGGARALGLETQIGSLTPGKWADLAAVNLAATRLHPVHDPLSQLVYACTAQDVSEVWVAGEQRVQAGNVIGLDENDLRARLDTWGTRIREATLHG
ncbi:MAG: TRZ/ATZ family hydrolase [Gammaproteobacteria bacterium]